MASHAQYSYGITENNGGVSSCNICFPAGSFRRRIRLRSDRCIRPYHLCSRERKKIDERHQVKRGGTSANKIREYCEHLVKRDHK